MLKLWLTLLWSVLRHPKDSVLLYLRAQTLLTLSHSSLMGYTRRAVRKVHIDPSFHPTKDHALKRNEAIEWTGHYLRDAGLLDPKIPWPTWEASFLVEWAVGELKGKL